MKETRLRELVREELLREQEEIGFDYGRGCIVMDLPDMRKRLEWDLVGSLDSKLNLARDWPSMYRAQGGDRFANTLQRLSDGSWMDCSIQGVSNLSVYEVDVVEFSKDRDQIFRAEGRDANRFYEQVLDSPFDLTDRYVLDQIDEKI